MDHVKNFMPDKLALPSDESSILGKHGKAKQLLLDIMQYPWKNARGGGGGRKRKTNIATARPIMNRRFSDMWMQRGFKRLRAFGIKNGDAYHWSVCIIEKGRIREGYMYSAFVFVTRVKDDHERILQEYIALKYT